jgi:thiamine pyrophosphokinase
LLGLAIIGGEGPAPEVLREIAGHADIIVAADSGLAAAEDAGVRPDWVVGDMDSLDAVSRLDKYPAERVLRYPHDKDYTDTELAFTLLCERGCSEIWLSGGGGGRTDHLLAVFSLFERHFSPDRWFTANEEIFLLREGQSLDADMLLTAKAALGGQKTALKGISVFPLGESPWEAESTGLTWPLDNLPWARGFFSLSNTAPDGAFRIRSLRGRFLVVVDRLYYVGYT